ncbi:hypothetical protein AC1031_001297 [Aphanomyces cochlioides]|nr:hypothetical protein AC1031_001291 [Aphanomyces cochlioides]KAG9416908.1 hypothetical protein AC1031_001297 [Aphanomyces cochlioides]
MQVALIVGAIVASAVSTQAGQCSTNWSQCNGQNWPHGVCCEDPNFECNRKNEYLSLCEPKKTPAPCKDAEDSEGCTNVSVEGDATFCVSGEICGDKGWSCPKKGAWASRDCVRNARSYVEAGKCVAPEDATCRKLKTGAWGCVWSSQDPQKDAEDSEGCTNVSVEGDATFCVSGEICGDKGWSCPKKGAWASRDCVRNARSYVEAGKCVAPEDATCRKLKTGAWGCVWSSQNPQKDVQVDVWQQCGGVDYRGDKSCSTGNICVKINEYYSQCQPDLSQPGLPTWSQCGGHGYNGETECRKEDKCKAWNSYYSQCVPRNN